jgi:hypothetical protein
MNNYKEKDLIKYKYQWGDNWEEGIGYVYNTANDLSGTWMVGNSCKNGGVSNISIEELKDIEIINL